MTDCPHDRIHHESRRRTFCKTCKRIMIRYRGDWIADPNGGITIDRKVHEEESE